MRWLFWIPIGFTVAFALVIAVGRRLSSASLHPDDPRARVLFEEASLLDDLITVTPEQLAEIDKLDRSTLQLLVLALRERRCVEHDEARRDRVWRSIWWFIIGATVGAFIRPLQQLIGSE